MGQDLGPDGESSDGLAVPSESDALDCPLCGYDLRGLPSQRCPECGHAFDLDELRRAKAERQHQILFEVVSRRRFRAFFITSLSSLWPPDLWRRMTPSYPINVRRLILFALIWAAVPLLAISVGLILVVEQYRESAASWALSTPPPFEWTEALLWASHSSAMAAPLVLLGFSLAWPFVAYVSLSLFGYTLSKAGMRTGHRWRVVLYPLPLIVMPILVLAVVLHFSPQKDETWGIGVGTTLLAVTTFHLLMAHVRYLRIRHAVAQAILVQLVALLSMAAAIALFVEVFD